jgi:hypothetical protein
MERSSLKVLSLLRDNYLFQVAVFLPLVREQQVPREPRVSPEPLARRVRMAKMEMMGRTVSDSSVPPEPRDQVVAEGAEVETQVRLVPREQQVSKGSRVLQGQRELLVSQDLLEEQVFWV